MSIESVIKAAHAYLDPLDVDAVVFHHPCMDGSGAALAAWLARGDLIEYIPMEHQITFAEPAAEEQLRDKNIILVDTSFKKEQLQRIRHLARKVLILDHHESAMKSLAGEAGCIFDMNYSGAVLSWYYFNGLENPAPQFFELIQDRDLWRWQYKDLSEPVYYALIARYPQPDFRAFAKYLEPKALEDLIAYGNKLIPENEKWCQEQAQHAKLCIFTPPNSTHKYRVICVEVHGEKLVSELSAHLYKLHKVDFILLWYVNRFGEYKISFRNEDPTVNLADLATSLGGGGHPRAAGVVLDYSPWELLQPLDKN